MERFAERGFQFPKLKSEILPVVVNPLPVLIGKIHKAALHQFLIVEDQLDPVGTGVLATSHEDAPCLVSSAAGAVDIADVCEVGNGLAGNGDFFPLMVMDNSEQTK